jgi:predicted phosphate transport protein (TIGR00153 family)
MSRWRLKKIRRTMGGRTTLQGALDEMARQKEEQVLEKVDTFTQLVVVTVSKLADVMQRFVHDEYSELDAAACELDTLESEADDLKAEILDRLAMGGVFFMGRADLARLVTSMDGIANYAVGAADRIAMRHFTLPAELNQWLVEMVQVDIEAVGTLREAVLAMRKDFRQAIVVAGKVDKLESRADSIFSSMYRFMFDMDTDFKTFHQLKAIIERLESIADKCSQNAELIRHMALEYLEE